VSGFERQYITVLFVTLLVFFISLAMPVKASAFIMPAEQVLYLMGTNFSRFKTLVITQSTHLKNRHGEEAEMSLNEEVWLKTPGFYDSELIHSPEAPDGEAGTIMDREPGGDMTFRRLLMAEDLDTRMSFLTDVGIDINFFSLTRFEGIIAYQLGSKGPSSPKLVVDKETFLPVFFCYRSQRESDQGIVTVHFGDYRQLGKGWYPFDIVYTGSEGIIEHQVVLDIKMNTSIDRPLSEIVIKSPLSYETINGPRKTPEDKNLKEIIEFLKKRYK